MEGVGFDMEDELMIKNDDSDDGEMRYALIVVSWRMLRDLELVNGKLVDVVLDVEYELMILK